MKKFLTVLASAAVLAMPLAVISTPAVAHTSVPAAGLTPAQKAMHDSKHKAMHAKAKAKHKMKRAKARTKAAVKAS